MIDKMTTYSNPSSKNGCQYHSELKYQLKEEDLDKQVTDTHLDDIASSYCSKWRSLPPRLTIRTIVVSDIDRTLSKEEDRRKDFLYKWRDEKGFEATYRVLIEALLGINCANDAGCVCQLVKTSSPQAQPDEQLQFQSEGSLPVQSATESQPEHYLQLQPEGSLLIHAAKVVLPVAHCPHHAELKEELKLYCETPVAIEEPVPEHSKEEALCVTSEELDCDNKSVETSGKYEHDYQQVMGIEACEKYKEKLEEKATEHKKALAVLDIHLEEVCEKEAATEDKIHATFRRLRNILDVREAELITQLSTLTQKKLKGLEAQKKQIEDTLDQLESCTASIQESLNQVNRRDTFPVCFMDMVTVNDIKEVLQLEVYTVKFSTEAELVFSVSENMHEACLNYGQLLLQDSSNNGVLMAKDVATSEEYMSHNTNSSTMETLEAKFQFPCSETYPQQRISEQDFDRAMEKLEPYSHMWKTIGRLLGFTPAELSLIEVTELASSCMDALLLAWTQWAPGDDRGSSYNPSLCALRRAVDKAGMELTAQELVPMADFT